MFFLYRSESELVMIIKRRDAALLNIFSKLHCLEFHTCTSAKQGQKSINGVIN
jgi:hypothetical protein